MNITEKRDVKNHLSLRHSKDIYLCEPLSRPDATSSSVVAADAIETNISPFLKDYCADHTLAAIPATATPNSIGSAELQAPETSKSARP